MFLDGIVRQRLMAAALWVLLAGAAAYLFFFEPGRSGFFPVCPFRALTGFNCPGCGTARALHQLLHGNAWAAFELNPLLVLLLPVLGYLLLSYTICAIAGRALPRVVLPQKYVWVFSALVLGFWVLRNTAVYPFPL
jgi:hypothetical protein